jgi:hypothetical protein
VSRYIVVLLIESSGIVIEDRDVNIRVAQARRGVSEQVWRAVGEEGEVPECVGVVPAGAPAPAAALHALGAPCVTTSAHAPDARHLLHLLYARTAKPSVYPCSSS